MLTNVAFWLLGFVVGMAVGKCVVRQELQRQVAE